MDSDASPFGRVPLGLNPQPPARHSGHGYACRILDHAAEEKAILRAGLFTGFPAVRQQNPLPQAGARPRISIRACRCRFRFSWQSRRATQGAAPDAPAKAAPAGTALGTLETLTLFTRLVAAAAGTVTEVMRFAGKEK